MKMGIQYWFLRHRTSHPPSELDAILVEQQAIEPPGRLVFRKANIKHFPLLLLLLLAIVLLVGISLRVVQGAGTAIYPSQQPDTPTGNPEGWQIQTVATRGVTGLYTDLVLDANGYPHISYIERVPFLSGTDEQLHYAYWDGIRWHQELVVEDLAFNTTIDPPTSLDLDTNGYPQIVYVDGDDLHYASWDGTEWEIQTVDGDIATVSEASLQLDTNNIPHISYLRGYDLVYAFWDGAAWQIEIIEANLAGNFNSLALDANNYPHISYLHVGEDDLKYAAYDGITWNIQTVDASEDFYGPTSLALATDGNPHISYIADSGNLKYAFWNGTGWQTEIVTTLSTNSVDVALALDTADNPHIIYSGSAGANILPTYLYQGGKSWQSQLLDPSASYPRVYNAFALDAEGDPHVAYFEAAYDDLRYVTWDTKWLTRTVQAPAAIQATSLKLSQGNPHISYYDGKTAEVKLVGWQEAWTQIDLPLNPISNPVMQTSLAFTSSRIHLSYSVSGSLLYLVWDGQDWDVQLVDTSATVGDYNQILAPGDSFVRIAYWDETNFQVKLAEQRTDGTWQIHTNTAGPGLDYNSGYLSATVLPEGKIGISYYDGIQGDLRLAVWDPETALWTDELIAGAFAYTGLLSALQTDGMTGEPVVAYYTGLGSTIFFAYKEGETWHIEPVVIETGGVTSLFLELGLNSRTRPRIAFTTYFGTLSVASKQDGNWVVEPVASNSPTLDNVSMALSDRPHLAYTDNGLFYAFRSATLDVDSTIPGNPSLPTGGSYNPMDACQAVLQLFIEGESLMARPPDAPFGDTAPLGDEAIFEGMNMLFAASPGGDYYIDLYGQHGSEMGKIGLDDPQLLWDAYGTLQNFLPGLEALVQGRGNDLIVTQEMVDDALDIWQRTAAAASPALAATINTELARYDNLQDFVGLTFAEWFVAIGGEPPVNHIYLPMITRNP